MGLISCDDVIKILNNEIYTEECEFDDGDCVVCWVVDDKYAVIEKIKMLPVIKSRPKGEWIGIGYDGYADGNPVYNEWVCSNCGHEIKTEDTPPYCEMCGAESVCLFLSQGGQGSLNARDIRAWIVSDKWVCPENQVGEDFVFDQDFNLKGEWR